MAIDASSFDSEAINKDKHSSISSTVLPPQFDVISHKLCGVIGIIITERSSCGGDNREAVIDVDKNDQTPKSNEF